MAPSNSRAEPKNQNNQTGRKPYFQHEGEKFGDILGVLHGQIFSTRAALCESRVHKSNNNFYCQLNGCIASMLLNRQGPTVVDEGQRLSYTWDEKSKNYYEEWKPFFDGLRENKKIKAPIRVIRSYLDKHNDLAPQKGYRYDGLYQVVLAISNDVENTAIVLQRAKNQPEAPELITSRDSIKKFLNRCRSLQNGKNGSIKKKIEGEKKKLKHEKEDGINPEKEPNDGESDNTAIKNEAIDRHIKHEEDDDEYYSDDDNYEEHLADDGGNRSESIPLETQTQSVDISSGSYFYDQLEYITDEIAIISTEGSSNILVDDQSPVIDRNECFEETNDHVHMETSNDLRDSPETLDPLRVSSDEGNVAETHDCFCNLTVQEFLKIQEDRITKLVESCACLNDSLLIQISSKAEDIRGRVNQASSVAFHTNALDITAYKSSTQNNMPPQTRQQPRRLGTNTRGRQNPRRKPIKDPSDEPPVRGFRGKGVHLRYKEKCREKLRQIKKAIYTRIPS